jgi:hypothetical protein
MWLLLRQRVIGVICAATSILFVANSLATPVTLYSTEFESTQGYNSNLDLAGQNQWVSDGNGGNGVAALYEGFGQSAYIGYGPLTTSNLTVWRPVNHNPTNRPVVTVTLDMSVVDSTNVLRRDEFRWSVYNIDGQRLFCIAFDNYDQGIYHQLDNGTWKTNDWYFDNDLIYTLEIKMNFADNRWSAWLGTAQIITNEVITTKNSARTFGDVDAVWVLRPELNPIAGDNFMVFDNLLITADVAAAPSSTVAAPLAIGGGQYLIRVNGTEGAKFAVQASTNLTSWTALKTNVITGGYFDYLDTTAVGLPRRYYRAKWIP